MRLFLHMPKCAGTSIKRILETLKSEKIFFDYESFFKIPKSKRSEKILNSFNNPTRINENEIVFGHFFPIKYIGDKIPINFKLVTILRDPIERLISHYYYWNKGDFSHHYLWRKMRQNNWTLSQFIMCSEIQNLYDQYFCQCPLQFFSYIGIYENLVESTQKCLSSIGLSGNFTDIPHYNITSNKLSLELSDSFIKEAQDFHALDYLIYKYAIKKFHSHFKPTL
jgi:hypothetical protein